MEEEDKKAELNSEIWKKHQKKEAKGLKKIFHKFSVESAFINAETRELTQRKFWCRI